jgi:ABC-type Fe3+ transport system permease subunit
MLLRSLLPTLSTLIVTGAFATALGVALAWAFSVERMMLMTRRRNQ